MNEIFIRFILKIIVIVSKMETLFLYLAFFSFISMLIGLVRPEKVIRWGIIKTRKRVLLFYGGAALFFYLAASFAAVIYNI